MTSGMIMSRAIRRAMEQQQEQADASDPVTSEMGMMADVSVSDAFDGVAVERVIPPPMTPLQAFKHLNDFLTDHGKRTGLQITEAQFQEAVSNPLLRTAVDHLTVAYPDFKVALKMAMADGQVTMSEVVTGLGILGQDHIGEASNTVDSEKSLIDAAKIVGKFDVPDADNTITKGLAKVLEEAFPARYEIDLGPEIRVAPHDPLPDSADPSRDEPPVEQPADPAGSPPADPAGSAPNNPPPADPEGQGNDAQPGSSSEGLTRHEGAPAAPTMTLR